MAKDMQLQADNTKLVSTIYTDVQVMVSQLGKAGHQSLATRNICAVVYGQMFSIAMSSQKCTLCEQCTLNNFLQTQ